MISKLLLYSLISLLLFVIAANIFGVLYGMRLIEIYSEWYHHFNTLLNMAIVGREWNVVSDLYPQVVRLWNELVHLHNLYMKWYQPFY